MRVVEAGQLDGEFEGFEDRDRVFTFLSTGTKWRQDEYRYYYRYAYMPGARVVERNGRHYLEVDGVGVNVAVVREWAVGAGRRQAAAHDGRSIAVVRTPVALIGLTRWFGLRAVACRSA